MSPRSDVTALAWFVCPYTQVTNAQAAWVLPGWVGRYPAVADFASQIGVDGGAWAAGEILGNMVLAKVRASAATLNAINQAANVLRIPSHVDLTDTLGDLTAQQRTAILNELLALGYSQSEVMDALPVDWQSVTLGQVLRFAATRRFRSRVDKGGFVFDGPRLACRPVEEIAAAVS